jgi:hypothetical protein
LDNYIKLHASQEVSGAEHEEVVGMIYAIVKRLQLPSRKKLIAVGVSISLASTLAGVGLTVQHSSGAAPVRDCTPNSIDSTDTNGGCGAASPAEFVEDLHANKPGDLKDIYADPQMGGLTPADYDRFEKTAVMGIAHKNGEVTIDGKTVLTDLQSLGREKINEDSTSVQINGKTYWHSPASSSFVADEIPAMVMFDNKGEPEAAVLSACGNPIKAKKVKKAEFECKALKVMAVPGQADTFDFTTEVETEGNVTVNKVVYDFGDGSPQVTEANPATPVRHHFATPGTFTAKVTVFFNVPDKKQIVEVPPTKCVAVITVPPAVAPPTPTPVVPPVLPKAGPSDMLGLFVGTSAAGAAAHRAYRGWRSRK